MMIAVIEPSAWRPDGDTGPTAPAGVYGLTRTVRGPWHGVVWVERDLLDEDFDAVIGWARAELEATLAYQSRQRREEVR